MEGDRRQQPRRRKPKHYVINIPVPAAQYAALKKNAVEVSVGGTWFIVKVAARNTEKYISQNYNYIDTHLFLEITIYILRLARDMVKSNNPRQPPTSLFIVPGKFVGVFSKVINFNQHVNKEAWDKLTEMYPDASMVGNGHRLQRGELPILVPEKVHKVAGYYDEFKWVFIVQLSYVACESSSKNLLGKIAHHVDAFLEAGV